LPNTLGFGLEVVGSGYLGGFFLFVRTLYDTNLHIMLICYTLILQFALENPLSRVRRGGVPLMN